MLKIGLTGGLGSGKSTVSRIFAELGTPIVDTDEISHELTAPNGEAIVPIYASFGDAVFRLDGSLDRAAMRAQILADVEAKRKLEAILHPLIRREVLHRLAGIKAGYVLVVIPLLVETGAYDDLLDRVLVVDCSVETQVRRALARGGWSETDIREMIARQASREARLGRADDVLNTDCDLAVLGDLVAALDQKYQAISAQSL